MISAATTTPKPQSKWTARTASDKSRNKSSQTIVDLSQRKISNDALKSLFLKNLDITSLHLSYASLAKMTPESLWPSFPSTLSRLWLTGIQTNSDSELIRNLSHLQSLEWLYLNGCGLKTIPKHLPKSLKVLYLSRNELSADTFESEEIRKLANLEDVSLCDNRGLPRRFQCRISGQTLIQGFCKSISEYQLHREKCLCFLASKKFRAKQHDVLYYLHSEVILRIAKIVWDNRPMTGPHGPQRRY